MSTQSLSEMTSPAHGPSSAPHVGSPAGGMAADFGRVLRSEWTKLRSVRSTYWSLVAAAIAVVALAGIIAWGVSSHWSQESPVEKLTFDPTAFSLGGINLGQLAIGVLGVLVITSEYSTGMIRTTFAAVPQRRLVLAAKAAVFTAVTFVLGLVVSFAAFFLGQALFASQHIQTTIDQPGVLRAVIGGGLYLAVLGLLAFGLGALIRHTAGAIATLFGIVLVLPIIAQLLPSSWRDNVVKYLPSNAGGQIWVVRSHLDALSPWAGFGVFCAYAAVVLAAAAYLVTRRDA